MKTRVKLTRPLVLLAGALCLGACGDLDIPDLNNPSLELLRDRPTRSAVNAAATGLLIGHRVDVAAASGYVSMLGILGRESYNFDAADPRFVTEMLMAVTLDPGSPRFGGNFWSAPYSNIRNANLVLTAVGNVSGMSEAEREAIRGFAKTIQALDFLVVINTRDTYGAPIDVGGAIDELAPIASKDEVFAHIATLLDQAKAHLEAGGNTFPFPLDDGFGGFRTPATFLRFSRAVKARVDVYRGDFAAALAELGESFIAPGSSLDLGVYTTYGTGSGDTLNGLISPNLFAHPSIIPDADRKANGDVDDRVTRKVKSVTARTVQGITSDLGFSVYPGNTSPVPVIRNEELILLRAEANIGLGNVAAAADDINFIRTASGGLAPRLDLDASNILDELLKQKRYSLLYEGGHRWIDLRRYGRLQACDPADTTGRQCVPLDLPTHHIHDRFPIPVQEMDPRE